MNSDKQAVLPGLDLGEATLPFEIGAEARWLGLSTDHRRLFDALQDGWLRPVAPSAGLSLGVGAYADEPHTARSGNFIPVRLKLSVEKLPDLVVFTGEQWMPVGQCTAEESIAALYWPGALPTFAISELAVETEEQRTRLMGLAGSVSNVELPAVSIIVSAETSGTVPPFLPCQGTPKLVIPPEEDSIHGAMSMALWAAPRIDPWMDVLVASLSFDLDQLVERTAKVDAGWLRFPPWMRLPDSGPPSDDPQDRLWLAAVDVFRKRSTDGPVRPRELAEEIAATVQGDRSGDEASGWLQTTGRILRAESTIQPDHWRSHPVGTAIQLALLRPDPTKFGTWCKDLPDLSPAVWWSSAMLCGLHCGYRHLDTRFRGQDKQRERIAIQALRASSSEARELNWPFLAAGSLQWRPSTDGFKLLWGDTVIAHEPKRAPGKWYVANFDDERVRRKAQAIAKKLGWPCLHRELRLTHGELAVSGPGNLKMIADKLKIQGGGVDIRLPPDAIIEDALDVESFRHLAAVEAGRLREPPPKPSPDVPTNWPNVIPGLTYKPDFLSEAEERQLVETIDRQPWSEELQRRVQHYGWLYDYSARRVDSTMHIGPLPEWAQAIAERLFQEGLVPHMPNQVIVNEYVGDQGISRHVDSDSFADGIAMVSLLESWEMVFRRGGEKRLQRLDKRSVAIMRGESRYRWTHEIPKRKTEPGADRGGKLKRGRIKRGRRVSLTFRRAMVRGNSGPSHNPAGGSGLVAASLGGR